MNEEELDSISTAMVYLFYPIAYIFDKVAVLQNRILGSPKEENAIQKAIQNMRFSEAIPEQSS
jgi:hypothetical protein